jgi:hypothetical protein
MQKIKLHLNENKFKNECDRILKYKPSCNISRSEISPIPPTSEEYLFNAMKNPKLYDISVHKNLIDFSPLKSSEKFLHIIDEYFPNCSITSTGSFLYEPYGYMGWHTNADLPYKTIYLTYVSETNKSFFRYYDLNKKEIVTDYDEETLNIRIFDLCDKNLFWHCVYSECNRFSFGFKIVNNL